VKTRILIVDDHPVALSGIRTIFESKEDIEIIGDASDGYEAIAKSNSLKPDIIVMDISMPKLSGIKATREILKNQPDIKIIALSIHSGDKFVKEMLDAGAVGYILKEETSEELLKAIDKVVKGDMFLSSGITRTALRTSTEPNEILEISILQSKLHRPPLLPDYVVRSKIIQELENNIVRPLTIVSAGAGYGKSVTVSQWLEQTKYLKSWISLDNEHNDIRIFLVYLIAAIEKIIPGLLPNMKKLIAAANLPPIHELSNILINDLCDIDEDLILVLDDYHMISERKIHDLLDAWLRFPPPSIHLCLITRRDPPLNLKSLRLTGRLTEVRMHALSFSNEEIAEFFELIQQLQFEKEDIELLHAKTEGWIIALRLMGLTIKNRDELKMTLKSLKGGLHSISEYLFNEVYTKQPKHVQEMLLEMSILNRFCGDLINEICTIDDISNSSPQDYNILEQLKEFNLFMISLDDEQKWYRYHHLFQEFLLSLLKSNKDDQEIEKLELRASEWFEQNYYFIEAIEHAFRGGDINRLVRIITDNWENALDIDLWTEVERWISFVPQSVLDQNGNLLLAQIWIAQRSHRLHLVPELTEKVGKIENSLSDAEKGYLAFAKCMLNYLVGDQKNALDASEKALRLIPEQYKCFRADTYSYWTFAMLMNGRIKEAYQQFERNLKRINPIGESTQTSRTLMHPCFLSITSADIQTAKFHNDDFFKIERISPYMMGWGTYMRSMISWWSYDLAQSIIHLDQFLQYRYQSATAIVIDGYTCLALANLELGRIEEAENAINKGLHYAEEMQDPVAQMAIGSGQARLNLKNGKIEKAKQWLKSNDAIPLNPTMFFWVEIASITRCRILIAEGETETLQEALALLEEYRIYSESIFNKMRTIDILILETLAHKKLKQEREATEKLSKAVQLSAPGAWIRPFAEYYNELHHLLMDLKEKEVNLGFIDKIAEVLEKERKTEEHVTESQEYLKTKSQREKLTALTVSEMKILEYIAQGLRNKEIADKLFNSEETIKKHIYNMFQKLQVKNRLSLVAKAQEEGILK
jgi:LuxR family maltose regulon positive regulatory protein